MYLYCIGNQSHKYCYLATLAGQCRPVQSVPLAVYKFIYYQVDVLFLKRVLNAEDNDLVVYVCTWVD